MKLAEIPADTVRRALEIYLRLAYSGPSRWRAPAVDLAGGETAADLVARFSDESERRPQGNAKRFVLRLGNDRYPHMKLVLEESLVPDDYVFAVDTHDDVKVSPESPDFERWTALREHNRQTKDGIETAWRAERIPTLEDCRNHMGSVERLGVDARTILVVDDDEGIRETLRTLLERAGARVRTARDGAEALEAVAEEPPQLILMDYQMPRMDGVTCCESLKADPGTRGIKVLLATASQVDLSTLTYADGFLVKPYRQDILFSLVKKLLS